MKKINSDLKEYIEKNVLPEYNKNEKAHGIEHINYVIERTFKLIEQNNLDVDYNMAYVIAAYHDIGHYINPDKHEQISADIMFRNKDLEKFFTIEQLTVIKEAIEDHRASAKNEPRSIYGKIVSSADRNITIEACLERTYLFAKKHIEGISDKAIFERSFHVLTKKYGDNGYAKFYFKDEEYEEFLRNIREILKNKEEFCKIQKKYIYEKIV